MEKWLKKKNYIKNIFILLIFFFYFLVLHTFLYLVIWWYANIKRLFFSKDYVENILLSGELTQECD